MPNIGPLELVILMVFLGVIIAVVALLVILRR
jgi:hypothetical protein